MNVVILRGNLSRAPSIRTLPSGDTLVTFEVTTRPPEGPAESVPVAWPNAPKRAAALPPGAEVVVTGRVRRRFFKAGGTTASRTESWPTPCWPRATASGSMRRCVAPSRGPSRCWSPRDRGFRRPVCRRPRWAPDRHQGEDEPAA